MEKAHPGVLVYIACRDSAIDTLSREPRVLKQSEMNKEEFGYVRELMCDMQCHPVEQFMKESNIPCGPVPTKPNKKTGKCVLVTQGMLPTRSLNQEEIQSYKKHMLAEGCNLSVDGDVTDAEFVMGVESASVFQAAADGARTVLIATGFGENLFKCMYPRNTVLKF